MFDFFETLANEIGPSHWLFGLGNTPKSMAGEPMAMEGEVKSRDGEAKLSP